MSKNKQFRIRIRYLDEATFEEWDDAVTFLAYALKGGINGIEVSTVQEDAEEENNEKND